MLRALLATARCLALARAARASSVRVRAAGRDAAVTRGYARAPPNLATTEGLALKEMALSCVNVILLGKGKGLCFKFFSSTTYISKSSHLVLNERV